MSSRSGSTGEDLKVVASFFFRLAQQAVAIDPVTYDLIVHPKSETTAKISSGALT